MDASLFRRNKFITRKKREESGHGKYISISQKCFFIAHSLHSSNERSESSGMRASHRNREEVINVRNAEGKRRKEEGGIEKKKSVQIF